MLMGKVNVNSRNNYLTTNGIIDLLEYRVDQSLTTTSDPQFNSLTITTSATIGTDLEIIGNLTVGGNTTVISTDVVEIKDNIVELNAEETGSGVTLGAAGLEVNRGAALPYRIVFDEASNDTKIGEVGSLQSVVTRQDFPLNKGIMVYNNALKRIDATQSIELTTSFLSAEASTSATTGGLRVSGGLGVVGRISVDGPVYFRGNGYSNYIDADGSDNLSIVCGNNMILSVPSTKVISVPQNTYFAYDGGAAFKRIYASPTVLNVENTTGDISFATLANGSLNIPANTYLQWGSGNNIRYDSTNVVLNSSGQFLVNPVINSANSTASSSSTTGGLVLSGGLGINNTTDATSSTVGGSFTSAGGVAVAKKLFVGDQTVVGETNTTTTQGSNQGINTRSLSRTLTTVSTNDTAFNSIEGGVINTASVIPLASSLYISSAPSIIGGGSITNSYALYINSGQSYLGGAVNFNDSTPSSSVTVGALKLVGGISINNFTNASTYASGGGITNGGGLGVTGDTYTGGKIDVGALSVAATQTAGQGITFRSRDRILTTSSTNNTVFNSFEGGSISSVATIPVASTVLINSAPVISGGGVITNSYALQVNSGRIISSDTTASTSSSSGSLQLAGGFAISNTTDASSFTNGGSITTAGGVAVGKSGYFGGDVNVGLGNSLAGERVLQITNSDDGTGSYASFKIINDTTNGLVTFLNSSTKTTDGGANNATIRNDAGALNLQGSGASGLNISTTGVVSGANTTASSSSEVGALLLLGGIGINNSTNAISSTNGGSFTTAGGMAVTKDLYVGGLFDVNGIANLDQTNIDTTDGVFSVTGTNSANINVGNTSSFTTSSGSITVDSQAGSLILDGHSGITIDSATSGISIDVAGNSNFTLSSGILDITAPDINITSTAGALEVNTTTGINLETTSTANGINIGVTHATVPIFIGNAVSEVTINDNLTVAGDLFVAGTTTTTNTIVSTTANSSIIVNFSPIGTSDGGLVMRRYQTPNDGASGDVIQDPPKETGAFGANSTGVDQLTLDATASVVNGYYVGWWILVTSGAGQFQVRRIYTYNGTTKVAVIYNTSDNFPPTIVDGLDLTTAVSLGDTYSLFDAPYQGVFYDESLDLFKFAAVSSAPESGEFPTTTSLTSLLLKQIYVDEPFPEFNGVIVDHTDPEALLVRKNTDGGDVFKVNTTDGDFYFANPINTTSSSVDLFIQQKDNANAVQTYSSINSVIVDNISGNLKSTLSFKVQNDTEGLTEFLALKGGVSGSSFIDVVSAVDAMRIQGTTTSSSSATGVLRLSGGLGINHGTDAVSTINGGSLTTSGGAAIALKLFVGGNTTLTSTTTVGTTVNSLVGTEGGLNINGDVTLYNASGNKVMFRDAGSAAPAFTNRSAGTKIVLKPEISGSSSDFAFGIDTDTLWYSVPASSDSHLFYTGVTSVASISSTGISVLQTNTGISFTDGANTSMIKETSGALTFVPFDTVTTDGFIFRDSSDTNSRVRINSDGQMSLALSSYSSSPGSGKFLNVTSQSFTDNDTAVSGTTSTNSFVSVGQPTLAATNASVTTTDSINTYVGGAPIRGTNQAFTNAYGIYVENAANLTSIGTISTASSVYIKNAPAAGGTGVITNAYSLFVDEGTSRFDGKVVLPTTTLQVSDTTNTLTSDPGSINSYGDIILQNPTRQGIYFTASGSAVPALTNRSVGSKIILKPEISGSAVDYAIGVSSSSSWYSVPTTSQTHDFYLGTLLASSFTSSGLVFGTASSALISPNTSDATDNKGIIITGGGSTGITRGAQIEVYGNELNTGNVEIKSGSGGQINLSTNGSTRVSVLNGGSVSVTSTTDTTGTGTGSIYTSGGLNVDKSIFVGTNLTMNFNQAYEFTGDVSGRLNLGTKTSGIASNLRLFTNDGDNSDNNLVEVFGLGTKSSLTNTEYLRIGYAASSTEYNISSLASGTGTVRPISLSTGANTDQLKLLANGNVTLSSTTATSSSTTGALRLSGGLAINNSTNASSSTVGGSLTTSGGAAIAQDLYVGGNLIVGGSIGVTTPSTTISSEINITGSVTTSGNRNFSNGTHRTFSVSFICTPTAANSKTSFEFTIPERVTNFVNLYDVMTSVNGYYGATPESVENTLGFSVVGSTRGKIQFTSSSTGTHVIQATIMYTAA